MKHLIKHLALIAAVALPLLCGTPAARAQQYAFTTLTNNTGLAIAWATGDQTNWNAAVTLTRFDSFVLEVRAAAATALAGPINLRWSTSQDGTTWTSTTPGAAPLAGGWFGAHMSNGTAGLTVWSTNITVNSVGYWRIENGTNQTGVTITNFNLRAYTKPRRTG